MATYTLPVLDHGFVTLHNVAGPTRRTQIHHGAHDYDPRPFDADDTDPANAARMSFDNFDKTRLREADLKLADYLMKNRHTTPFEMIEVWVEMKLPIFVARQFVRHRTVSINEVSARYVTLPDEWYIPEARNVGLKANNKKQGRDISDWNDMSLTERDTVHHFNQSLDAACRSSYNEYKFFIDAGIAPELARSFLHVNHYTHWLWKQDLHNMMHFLSLRVHNHAQFEARVYADAILSLLQQFLPNCMELFDKYRRQV